MGKALAIALFAAALTVSCGDGTTGKDGNGNNDSTNNASTNNGATNNDATNGSTNGATNGSTNGGTNGSTNGSTNGATNNSTNNGTNNSTNNQTNNGTNNGNPSEIETFEKQFWDAFCEAMFQCETRDTALAIAFVGSRFETEADCKASTYRGDTDFQQLALGEMAGRVSFDGTDSQACADAFKDALCDPMDDGSALQAACDPLTTPMVAEGDACALDQECIDSACDTSGDACDGVCTVPPDPAECGDETCDLATEYCGTRGNMRTCLSRKNDGQACESDEECMDGSGCLQSNVAGGTCTALYSLAENEPCGGETRFCEVGTICVGQQVETCQTLEFGADGDTCTLDGQACEAGLACQDLTLAGGTCGPPRQNGEDCQFSFQCAIDLYCDGFSFAMPNQPGTCLPRLANGETCDANGDCDSEFCDIVLDADEGTCADKTYCVVP